MQIQETGWLPNEGFFKSAISKRTISVVFAPKKDRKVRLCVDYRKLNANSRDIYSLPRLDDCLKLLRDAIVLSTMVSNSGYRRPAAFDLYRNKISLSVFIGCFDSSGCRLIQSPRRHRLKERQKRYRQKLSGSPPQSRLMTSSCTPNPSRLISYMSIPC